MKLTISIAFGLQENDLLSREVFFFKTCFSSVNIFDHVAFLEFPFERLEHLGFDRPVLIANNVLTANNAARDFSLLDANVSDYRNCFVIAAEIAERWPFLIVLSQHAHWQNEKNDEGFEQEFQSMVHRIRRLSV